MVIWQGLAGTLKGEEMTVSNELLDSPLANYRKSECSRGCSRQQGFDKLCGASHPHELCGRFISQRI